MRRPKSHVLIMAFLIHDNLLMREFWGFSYMTFGAILANLVCNAVKAGMACAILHMKKCNGLRKLI